MINEIESLESNIIRVTREYEIKCLESNIKKVTRELEALKNRHTLITSDKVEVFTWKVISINLCVK